MRSLQSCTPADSRLKLLIVCGETDINGFLSIRSQQFQSEASRSGSDVSQTVEKLSGDIRNEIRKWLENRQI